MIKIKTLVKVQAMAMTEMEVLQTALMVVVVKLATMLADGMLMSLIQNETHFNL
jgi:hypothetical protein